MSTFTTAIAQRAFASQGRTVPPTSPYPPPLPPGTRVKRVDGVRTGTVGHTIFRSGVFPVDFDGGFSEICGVDDVLVLPGAANRNGAA
jgi:hypothetical protein